MGDETDAFSTLRERIARLEEFRDRHMEVHVAERLAVSISDLSLNRRLDEMNNLRKQIDSERGDYILRDWFEKVHASLEDRIKILENGENRELGMRQPLIGLIKWIGALIGGLILACISWLFGKSMK